MSQFTRGKARARVVMTYAPVKNISLVQATNMFPGCLETPKRWALPSIIGHPLTNFYYTQRRIQAWTQSAQGPSTE